MERSDGSNPIRVALVQRAPVFLNLEESLAAAADHIREAAANGAGVVVFPETWLPGYPVWLDHAPAVARWDETGAKQLYRLLQENAVAVGDGAFQILAELAENNGVYLVMGCHERVGNTLYNSQLFFGPRSGMQFCRRKLMPTYNEKMIWGRGDGSGLHTLETPAGPLGGLICWEHWMPLARAAMHARGEVIHVAQWPSVGELHQLASRHYAFEGSCFVLACGTVLSKAQVLDGFDSLGRDLPEAREMLVSMGDKEWVMTGGSCIIGPDAGFVQEPVVGREDILYGDLDPDRIKEAGLLMDSNGHYSRPDIFTLSVNTRPMENVCFEAGASALMEDLT